MIIPAEITRDIETALDVLVTDTSATWLNTAAADLEDAARRIREATKGEADRTAAIKDAKLNRSLDEAQAVS